MQGIGDRSQYFPCRELTQNNILSKDQYGFRSGLSTSHAVQYFVKYIVDNINCKNVTAAIYLDFSRAFDSVNYELLFLKLQDMGISNMLIRWIKGYLLNRKMCTKFNGHISPTKPLACGVPQGSVIGPILFLCYVNDIVDVTKAHDVCAILYADDTVIFEASKDVHVLQQKLQDTVNDISIWCNNNRIKLNVSKTKSCFYGTRHVVNRSKFNLTLNNDVLHPCQQYKYLGVILDETMSMDANYNNIFKRFSYKVFQFSKIKSYLTISMRILVYKQTVLPFIEYISSLLFLNRKLDVDKLQKLQNKALRMCLDIYDPREVSVLALHNQCNISRLNVRRELLLLGLMFDLSKDPNLISLPGANTRQAEKITFNTDIVHLEIYRRSPFYVGTLLWNRLSAELHRQDRNVAYKNEIRRLYQTGLLQTIS